MKLKGGIATLALFALLSLPSAASAGSPGDPVNLGKAKGIKYFSAAFKGVSSQGTGPLECPAGLDVFGGGGQIGGPADDALLNESYPLTTGGQIGWAAEASADETERLTTFAICGPSVVTYASQESPLNGGFVITSEVTCPIGFSPVSGGMSATGPALNLVGTEPGFDPSARWSTTAENEGINDTIVEAHAICTGNYKLNYRTETEKLRANKGASLIAKCKESEAVVGGGFSSDDGGFPSRDSHVVTTRPWDSKDKGKTPEDGWQAETSNDSNARQDLVVTAVCFKRKLSG